MKPNVQPNQTSIDELFAGMTTNGKYDYLRIILSKNDCRTLGQQYLMITKSGFGLVKLLDVEYNDRILMEFQCLSTGIVKQIAFDVEDETFKFLLIDWNDIKGMVYEEVKTDNELLDFDY